jgi:diguanylate cyclase (GGDEF)-like protein
MSFARSSQRSIYLGDTIVAEMRSARLPFEPRQFEFWFAYKSGNNAALKSAANDIKAKTGALTGSDIERLHEAYLSPWRMAQQPDSVTAHMGAKLQELAVALEAAIGTAEAQRETLATEAAELSVTSAMTLYEVLGAIGRLTQSTKESQARFALFEARVDAVGREIGALRQQLAAVREDCAADPITQLPNRASFDAVLIKSLAEAAEARQPMAVMLCNLDYFAAFNENFGNQTGDQVLRSIGLLFKAHLRSGDFAARFDGDEFATILPKMRSSEAAACAERFRQGLRAHELIPHPNGAGRVTVSIGVAEAIKGDTPEFLLRRVQNGLKVAKREGRNRVVEMSPDGPIWEAGRLA